MKLFSNELGIKFTKMNIERIPSDLFNENDMQNSVKTKAGTKTNPSVNS